MQLKRCARCKEFKPRAAFGQHRSKSDGLCAYCKLCRNAYRAENGERYRAAVNAKRATVAGKRSLFADNIKKHYGLSVEDYAWLLHRQDFRCAVCRVPFTDRGRTRPNVDHCHSTKRVRGLLCFNCNWGLGSFRDSPSHLRAAADYLEATL